MALADTKDSQPASREWSGGSGPHKKDAIKWSGNTCESKRLYVGLYLPPDVDEKSVVVETDESKACHQKARPIVTNYKKSKPDAAPDGFVSIAACSLRNNWIHTSHTLQDVVRIDLAWLRSSFRRYWNCDTTYWSERFGDIFAWAGSGPSWWRNDPPTFPSIYWGCFPVTFNCEFTHATVRADFHTDFAHCNAINQDIRLETAVYTYNDGGEYVEFRKNGSCPGVYSATGTRVNTSKTGGFGGGGSTVVARPS